MARLTVSLDADAGRASAEIGGKGEGLRQLAREGFEIPEGFCVTAGVFRRVARSCQWEANSLEELREAIRRVDVGDALRREVREHLERIGASQWAVRSSSLEEDRHTFSFAGQERTELDVEGVEGVLDAMCRVWADFFTLEGLLYRSRIRVDAFPSAMAVVVQEMVDPTCGGVVFTRDPVRAEEVGARRQESPRGEVLVTASATEPEGVVEGRSGSHYRFERPSGSAVERPDGDSLDIELLEDVVERSLEVERALEAPQNIEWAWGSPSGKPGERERLFFVQSRPITGSAPEAGAETVWTNANVGEALPGVATPFTWSIIGAFSRRGFERAFGTLGLTVPEDYELVGSFRGRVYLNLTQFVSVASGIPILQPEVLFGMAGGGGLELVRDVARQGSTAEFLKNLPLTVGKILAAQLSMPFVSQIWSRYFTGRVEKFFDTDRDGRTRGALAAELDRLDRLFDRNGRVMLTCSSNFLMSYVVVKTCLDWIGEDVTEDRERQLFEALDVRSAEPVLDLLELARVVGDHPDIAEFVASTEPADVLEKLENRAERGREGARRVLRAFEDFREKHGHRAPREAELSTPRWREESEFVFEVLQRYLETDDLKSPEEYRRDWDRQRREVDDAVEEMFGAFSKPIFRFILGWARETARIREFMRAHVVESLDMYRELVRECGRRLVDAGMLQQIDDVFFLRYEEIRAWLEGGQREEYDPGDYPLRVLVRRAVVERLRELPDPPNTFVLDDGEMVDTEEYRRRHGDSARDIREERDILHGLPGSRGRVTGRARVIRDPEEEGPVESGEILVAPHTDVGWTPMFVTASALVVGLGGPLSHACIVAREFGIPTVVNVRGAADVIESGDNVTVDGDEGIVIVHGGETESDGPARMADYRETSRPERSSPNPNES